MKKVLFILLAVFLLLPLLFFTKTKAETESQDQYCAAGNDFETLGNNGVSSQTFVPTKDRLSYINLKIGGIGLTGSTSITATVLESFNGTVIGSKSILPTMAESGIRQWVFAAPLTLDTSKTYQIKLEKIGSGTVYWYYGVGDQTCDGNNRTYGFRDSSRQSWDFNYETYGYDYVAPPVNENTNSGNSNLNTNANTNSVVATPAGQSTGSGTAPSASTSTSIKPATDLKAEQINNLVRLTWTKSTTTDVNGYKVFRSEERTKNFREIGKTNATTLEFVDQNLTVNKVYYYFVRAYKGQEESISTLTTEIRVAESSAQAVTTSAKKKFIPITDDYVSYWDYGDIQMYWILGGVISILLVALIAYEIDRKKRGSAGQAKHFRLLK